MSGTEHDKAAAEADEGSEPESPPDAPAEEATLAIIPDDPDAVDHLDVVAEPVSGKSGVKGKTLPLETPADDAPPPAQEEEVRRPKKGESVVVYQGLADSIEFGDYRFRPGQPVIVRSDVVEELLTMPNELFVEVKE